MLIHVINGEQSLARIDHVTSTCALVVGQSPSVRPWQPTLPILKVCLLLDFLFVILPINLLNPSWCDSNYGHITPSLIDLHWLPVEYRIIYKILLLVYKAINGLSPSYISNLLSFCSSSYSLRSCSNKLLQVPRSKLKSYGDRRFSIAGPKLWNSIPTSLRNTDSLNSFKKHLKTYLFHQAFS